MYKFQRPRSEWRGMYNAIEMPHGENKNVLCAPQEIYGFDSTVRPTCRWKERRPVCRWKERRFTPAESRTIRGRASDFSPEEWCEKMHARAPRRGSDWSIVGGARSSKYAWKNAAGSTAGRTRGAEVVWRAPPQQERVLGAGSAAGGLRGGLRRRLRGALGDTHL